MLKVILLLIVFFSAITLVVSRNIRNKSQLHRVLDVSLYAISFHASFAFLARHFFAHDKYIDTLAPFGLMYGPLLFFTILAIQNKLRKRVVVKHLIPFFLYFILYFLIVFSKDISKAIRYPMGVSLYILIPCSMVAYAIWALTVGFTGTTREGTAYRFFRSLGLWLISVALVLVSILFSKTFTGQTIKVIIPGLILYLAMLACVGRIFQFKMNALLNPTSVAQDKPRTEPNTKYSKSAIGNDLLDDYSMKVKKTLLESKPYLSAEFNLDALATATKIPKHHITQVFNLRLGENFSQHINRLRIEHACSLLEQNPAIKIDDVAYMSGFNTKASFNRNFKLVKGITPTEYKNF